MKFTFPLNHRRHLMNKNKLKFISITAALVLATTFTFSCSGDDGGGDSGGKTPLSTPANVRVDDAGKTAFTLKWDAVTGADSYTLDIDGELKQVSGSTTSYDLKALTADPKVYPIKVRAVADNGDEAHSNSAYSAPLDVEPAKYVFTYEDGIQTQSRLALKPTNLVAAGGGGTITGLTNYGKGLEKIVIPPKIGSVTVTTIGDDAFKDNPIMTAISLPETIITIGAGALSGTNIASLVIPESVLNIGDGAFSNIIVLVVVVFVSPEPPALGDGVFDGSKAIETIVVPDGSGSTYTEKIEEKAPDLAEQVAIEEAKEEKLLIGIEVAQPPKTAYTAGEQFSSAGMTVITRYSDNTTSSVTNYTVQLQTSNGGFSAQNRALTVNDTAVRLSYTEGSITRTTTITIKVTGQTFTLNGTWEGTLGDLSAAIIISGNDYTILVSGVNYGKGTITYSTSSFTLTSTHAWQADNNSWQPFVETVTGNYVLNQNAGTLTFSGLTGNYSDVNGVWTLKTQPTGYTITVNQTTGGTITTNPSGNVPAGTTITVTGAPNDNYYLASIRVMAGNTPVDSQESPDGGGYTFTMPASAVTVTGTFTTSGTQPTGYTITVNQTTGGTITTDPQGSAAEGTDVTITVSPSEGYTFNSSSLSVTTAAVSDNGTTTNVPFQAVSGSNNSYTFAMPAAEVTITGTFTTSGTQPSEYKISITEANNGTITTNPSDSAAAGTSVWITVTPNQGYQMSGLSVAKADGSAVNLQTSQSSTGLSYYFIMPSADVTISGTFTSIQPTSYAITVNQTTGGTITTNPSGNAPAGTTVTVTGAPDGNYYLASIRVMTGNAPVDSQESPDGSGYTFTMPAADVTVTGTFEESGWVIQTFLITTYVSIGGTITTDPSGSAAEGALVTVYATPDDGYAMASLLSVTSGNQTIDAQAKDTAGTIWTFTMPASDVVISGAFATRGGEPEYRITPDVDGNGSVMTNPSDSATVGTTVWIFATPHPGATMASLSVRKANGDTIEHKSDTNSATGGSGYTFTMPSMDVVINAEFTGGTTPSEYKIYVSETTGGTITTNPEGNAPAKSTVTVTVSPNQGYTFDSSSLSVVADNYPVDYQTSQSSTGVVYTFTMPDSDIIISGTFTGGSGQTGYTITTYAVGGTGNVPVGTITTNPSGSVAAGTSVKITGTPNDNYYLASIRVTAGNTLVDSQESPAGDGYIFTMPAAAVTVTGTFALKE